MICYASRTGTKRNLAALRAAGWRLLISRAGVWRTEGFPYALDNGAWTDHATGRCFDEDAFTRLLAMLGHGADWVVVPDIVGGGQASLDLSRRWLDRCLSHAPAALVAVQDGLGPEDLRPIVGGRVGIFLGGSTEYKLSTMQEWGCFCAQKDIYFHVARVNTEKRFKMAHGAGAHSVDGTNATRYSVNLPRLDRAARQKDLFGKREWLI